MKKKFTPCPYTSNPVVVGNESPRMKLIRMDDYSSLHTLTGLANSNAPKWAFPFWFEAGHVLSRHPVVGEIALPVTY